MRFFVKQGSFFFVFFLFAFFIFTIPSHAVEFGNIGIRPKTFDPESPLTASWFIYNLLPGETKQDALIITNNNSQAGDFKIYPVDATTTADGAFALKTEGDSRTGISSWITLENNTIHVGPNESKEVPFTITIPKKVIVGDHLGGVIVENVDIAKYQGINIKTRIGIRMYETVPGQLKRELQLEKAEWTKQANSLYLTFSLINKGNVRLEPQAKIKIGEKSVDLDLRMVLPEKPTKVPYRIEKLPFIGMLNATIEVTYGDAPAEKILYQTSYFYVSTTSKIVFAVSLVALLIMFFFSFIKKPSGKKRRV